MARLPPVNVSEQGFALINQYAAESNLSVAEAMRKLLESSSELSEFAASHNLPVNLRAENWGGRRVPKDVQTELDALRNKNS